MTEIFNFLHLHKKVRGYLIYRLFHSLMQRPVYITTLVTTFLYILNFYIFEMSLKIHFKSNRGSLFPNLLLIMRLFLCVKTQNLLQKQKIK